MSTDLLPIDRLIDALQLHESGLIDLDPPDDRFTVWADPATGTLHQSDAGPCADRAVIVVVATATATLLNELASDPDAGPDELDHLDVTGWARPARTGPLPDLTTPQAWDWCSRCAAFPHVNLSEALAHWSVLLCRTGDLVATYQLASTFYPDQIDWDVTGALVEDLTGEIARLDPAAAQHRRARLELAALVDEARDRIDRHRHRPYELAFYALFDPDVSRKVHDLLAGHGIEHPGQVLYRLLRGRRELLDEHPAAADAVDRLVSSRYDPTAEDYELVAVRADQPAGSYPGAYLPRRIAHQFPEVDRVGTVTLHVVPAQVARWLTASRDDLLDDNPFEPGPRAVDGTGLPADVGRRAYELAASLWDQFPGSRFADHVTTATLLAV